MFSPPVPEHLGSARENFVLRRQDEPLRSPEGLTQGPPPAAGTLRTLGLRDVDQAAEDLAHARLQGEVLGAAGHGNDQVGRFQVPVLGQQLVEGLGVRVTGQAEVLWGRGRASESARLLPTAGQRRWGRLGARGCHHGAPQASWSAWDFILKALGHL